MSRHLATWFFFGVLLVPRSSGETFTVCEALDNRLELNGRRVRIRGRWGIGDTGQALSAAQACIRPTVQDGWLFGTDIEVVPDKGNSSVAKYYHEYNQLRKNNRYVKVIVTLEGKFETRAHFETFKDAFGVEWPRAFNGFAVAVLRYWRAEQFEAIPYEPGEAEAELKTLRLNQGPKRIKDTGRQ